MPQYPSTQVPPAEKSAAGSLSRWRTGVICGHKCSRSHFGSRPRPLEFVSNHIEDLSYIIGQVEQAGSEEEVPG